MEQAISLNNGTAAKTIQFLLLLSLVVFAPLIGNQFVTGTIVNSVLLGSLMLFGLPGAVSLCFIPSIVSLFAGLLPWVMVPMVPFIIAGNILLVLVFDLLKKNNFFLGLILAALLKFSFLFFTGNYIIRFFVKEAVASNIAVMMSWPQLITALLGGIMVYLMGKFLKNNK